MNKNDIVNRIKKSGAAIGLDDESSSAIIQNLDATTMPMCVGSPFTDDEQETDEFKILFFALDASGSMDVVEQELINEFNNTVIPGLREGSKNVVAGIRVGGLIFNHNIKPLWGGGFIPLADLPPLTRSEYRATGSTALYRGAQAALTAAAAYALEIRQKTGSNPEIIVVVMSDGANNQPPNDPYEVYKITAKLSKEIFTLAFAGFETGERVDFMQIAHDMGFPEVFAMKKVAGESDAERKRRFRHLLKIMSSSLVGHVSKAQTGASSGFWQP